MIRKIIQFIKNKKKKEKLNRKYDEEYFDKVNNLIKNSFQNGYSIFLFKSIYDKKWIIVIKSYIELKREFENLKEVYNFLIKILNKNKEG